jgi:hypothetical protein
MGWPLCTSDGCAARFLELDARYGDLCPAMVALSDKTQAGSPSLPGLRLAHNRRFSWER